MCKTQVILDGFKLQKFEKKNLNGTRDPPPFMANAIQNSPYFFGQTSLRKTEMIETLRILI